MFVEEQRLRKIDKVYLGSNCWPSSQPPQYATLSPSYSCVLPTARANSGALGARARVYLGGVSEW